MFGMRKTMRSRCSFISYCFIFIIKEQTIDIYTKNTPATLFAHVCRLLFYVIKNGIFRIMKNERLAFFRDDSGVGKKSIEN